MSRKTKAPKRRLFGRGPAREPPPAAAELDEEWRDRRFFRLRPVYLVLAAIVLAATLLALIYPAIDVIERFMPNLATEAFGILLTLVFVHRFLAQQDRARRLRGSVGALRKGSRALRRLVAAWGAVIKGSLRYPPAEPPQTLEQLFTPHMTDNLPYADPRAERRGEDGTVEPWVGWAAREFAAAREALQDIIEAYGASLDPAYIEAADDLVDDPFLQLVIDLAADPALDARAWRIRLNREGGPREAHFSRLLWMLELHDSLAADAARVRTRRTGPRSSLGLRLDLDHDLRLPARVERAWWDSAPAPGSICAVSGTRRADSP